ncbi:hypothetical protein N7488_011263 [Penicillium malachiteum]|nr:hypothetical protein N7488_011263 [Penicillium malachiteum]
MPPTVTPVPPNYAQTYGYSSNNPPMTEFKDTYETRRGSLESHESHSSEPQTANTSFSQPHEKDDVYQRTQSPIHEQTKHKNLHRGRECKKIIWGIILTIPFCRDSDPCGPFKCKWEDCRYPGVFARKAVLMRHIETQHVTPKSFECPDKLCDRSFNRKDNMEEHWRRVH